MGSFDKYFHDIVIFYKTIGDRFHHIFYLLHAHVQIKLHRFVVFIHIELDCTRSVLPTPSLFTSLSEQSATNSSTL